MKTDIAETLRSQFLRKKQPDTKPDARELQFIQSLIEGSEWENQQEAKDLRETLITIANHGAFDTTGDGGLALAIIIRIIAFVSEAVGLLEPVGGSTSG